MRKSACPEGGSSRHCRCPCLTPGALGDTTQRPDGRVRGRHPRRCSARPGLGHSHGSPSPAPAPPLPPVTWQKNRFGGPRGLRGHLCRPRRSSRHCIPTEPASPVRRRSAVIHREGRVGNRQSSPRRCRPAPPALEDAAAFPAPRSQTAADRHSDRHAQATHTHGPCAHVSAHTQDAHNTPPKHTGCLSPPHLPVPTSPAWP